MIALTVDEAYRKAYEHYQSGRFDTAEDICRKLLNSDPGHVDAAYLLAVIVHRNGRNDEGDRLLRQAIERRRFSIRLSYLPPSTPRYAETPHPGLEALLAQHMERYLGTLESFGRWLPWLTQFPADTVSKEAPYWNNVWIPPLDGIALYCLICSQRPRRYLEVGSGNSTKFVRRAISDHGLDTAIISIDPQPREEIDSLCDEVVRKPLEEADLSLFNEIGAGDMVFVDNSHHCFTNSDVTVFFTEVLPALAKGVTVGIHDIFLPYDYPALWVDRYYSEQYLLACSLLSGSPRFSVILPVHYVSRSPGAEGILSILCRELPKEACAVGSSFWIEMH